jgi:tRNA-splicing ligase RtcB (3'-phosphate/5'-hydroxy nucleic acid ligase)
VEQISKRLFSWASVLEPNTLRQAETASLMPFIWPHMALMPDAHLGKGATVGSVIPTLGAVIPAAVGVDIGCGMIAHRTSLIAEQVAAPALRRRIREGIERVVPLSAGNYNHKLYSRRTERRADALEAMDGAESANRVADWQMQLGTLGSGNHFIEVSLDEEGRVWLFLHSGSRGVGNKLAAEHIRVAQEWCSRAWVPLPDPDLAYLVEGTPEFSAYIRDLTWAQQFALLNREEMMDRVEDVLHDEVAGDWHVTERVNCHHNYTEQMDGKLLSQYKYPKGKHGHVWLSRKGAIDASEGRPGLIPGSMGAASYVVAGLGNKLSLNSSPHGAGRNYSRAAAKREFTVQDLEKRMKDRETEWRHTDAFLDEHPLAYKDIAVVMADADDLVKAEHVLHQVVNVKGD